MREGEVIKNLQSYQVMTEKLLPKMKNGNGWKSGACPRILQEQTLGGLSFQDHECGSVCLARGQQ